MFSLILSIFFIIIKLVASVCLLTLCLCIGFRLWLEPFKGVCKCKTLMNGKVVLITGGNSGIGFETANDLAKRGARVVIASRNNQKSEDAVATIKTSTGNNNVEYRYLNLARQDIIRSFAEDFNKDFGRLDILVNNAGCGIVKAVEIENGIDMLMQINYVGPFLLTNLLLEKLIASKPSRIVNVSSCTYAAVTNFKLEDITKITNSSAFRRYATTKFCNVLWTRELAKRLPYGVTANVLHPGVATTNFFDKLNCYVKKFIFAFIHLVFKSPAEAAQTVIHLCVSPNLENSTGGYYVDCEKSKFGRYTENDELARQLWNRTIELTNT